MWKRNSRPGDARAATTGLGVGVQVYVLERPEPSGDDWVGEPTGVIVGPGDRSVRAVAAPADGLTTWAVAFSEPQHRRDGRGPFETAVIPAALLVAAEPME